ncbi:CRISPR-associated endonuclease Cas2 [Candidatus Kaiserbacteria bacterium]|nr:CRISPR-associated endonuclease Cas2 [Candidatus Kaiserbacteria bacterium]
MSTGGNKMEIESGKRRRKNAIQQTVLAAVGMAGLLTVAAVAPNIFQAFPRIIGKQRYKLAFQARTAVQRLVIKGHVQWVETSGKKYLEITESGQRALDLSIARASAPARKKRRWDRRWRMVIFDIPERRRAVRERLRILMHEFGFLRLQNSVWISPDDCEELIALIKADLKVGKDILYVIADSIENDTWIKKHFELS